MSAAASPGPTPQREGINARAWRGLEAAAPQMASTMQAYLDELATTLSYASVYAAGTVLRDFACRAVEFDPACKAVADVTAAHVADHRAWLTSRRSHRWGPPMSARTVAYRVAMLRLFFERIRAWGWDDCPPVAPLPRDVSARAPSRRAVTPTPLRGPRRRTAAALITRPRPEAEMSWDDIATQAPEMAATMQAYLAQLGVSSRPSTVVAASLALRHLAAHLVATDPACRSVAAIERRHIESYKLALAARTGARGDKPIATQTVRHNLGMVRTFFERVIDWGYDDAPRRVPVFTGDIPKADEPLPKFLDDPTAAKFMAALVTDPNRRRRLMVELLARTGMRVGELAGVSDDAMYKVGSTWWLRVPVGKLHNDRMVPLHPMLVGLINDYRAWRGESSTGLLVERDDHQPFDRRTVHRYVAAVARRAGVGHVHPHQLRHTLATQCINRGMSLDAVAALLGHRSPRMTIVYARVSDATVSEQYFRAIGAVESQAAVPAGERSSSPALKRLLGNGWCTRPLELDCRFQTICEGCGFDETGAEFVPILLRQRDDAAAHADVARANLYNELIRVIDEGASSTG
jgi:integrase